MNEYELILTGFGLIVAITYYSFQIRNQNKTRQAQLFMRIYQDRNKHENMVRWFTLMNWTWEDYDDWLQKYDNAEPEIASLPYETRARSGSSPARVSFKR